MTRSGEKGVALVFTLFLMAALSAMAVSLMFLAQTETSASRNYKTMSQARYGGEAGVHRALHYLSSTAYTSAVTTTTGFDTTVSPVTYGGNPVVLAPVAANSNHPDTAIKTAYAALFSSTNATLALNSGATLSYTATATLISMRSVNVYGGNPQIVQNWRIAATGTVPGARAATVEVAAILERDSTPAETYAIFATGTGCGAITMVGNVITDSYDSQNITTWVSGHPATAASAGAVGTNGNLSIAGQVTVNGNLDTPRTGVGACTTGNVTALSETGSATVTGDRIQLPQPKIYPTPSAPSPTPPTSTLTINASTSCAALTLLPGVIPVGAICSGSLGNITITTNGRTLSWGNVQMSGGAVLTLTGGSSSNVNVNVNSWSVGGNAQIKLGASTSVTLNAEGAGIASGGSVIDFTGGSLSNGTGATAYDPSKFQILYAGTGQIKVGGTSDTAATIYAPNAYVDMNGNAGFYGSVLSNTFKDNGGASVHYDTSLAARFNTLGQHVMSSFSWQKY